MHVGDTLPTPAGAQRAIATLEQLLAIPATSMRAALTATADVLAGALGAEKIDVWLLDPGGAVLVAIGTSDTPLGHRQHALGLDLPTALPVVGDRRLLEQLLVNLLANAHRHTPTGTRVWLAGRVAGDEVRVEVRDEGPGIGAEVLDGIFTRFRHGESGSAGTGLGLTIARDIALLHGGRLEVDSEPGRGAAFHLILPHAGAGEAGEASAPPAGEPNL